MNKLLLTFLLALLYSCKSDLVVSNIVNENESDSETFEDFCLNIDIKVFLGSRYNTGTGLMSTALAQKYLLPGLDQTINPNSTFHSGVATPVGQPFNIDPWFYNGNEGDQLHDQGGTVVSPYPGQTVDWILVSLRHGGINKEDQVHREAYLLLEDGSISKQSSTCFKPDEDQLENYYIVVEHHNFLRVMSHIAIDIEDETLTYDFTIQDSYKTVNEGQLLQADGKYAMYGADFDQNGVVNIDDRNNYISVNFNTLGHYFYRGDIDGNGYIVVSDITQYNLYTGAQTDVPGE